MFADKQYGKRTVLEMLGTTKCGQRLVRCRCECGLEKNVQLASLKRGDSTQCLSCAAKARRRRESKDLTGAKYGKWTVLEMLGTTKCGHRLVRCRCECKVEKDVQLATLKRGDSTQCLSCAAKARHRRDIEREPIK